MEDIKPFKYNLGEVVYICSAMCGSVLETAGVVVHRFVTPKGNFYNTMQATGIPEYELKSENEYIISKLAGKFLEI